MNALIVDDILKKDKDIAKLAQTVVVEQESLRVFSLTSDLAVFPVDHRMVGNIFYCRTIQVFDHVILGHSVRLFPNAWGKSFIRHACSMCVPGGTLTVPFSTAGRHLSGLMPLETLTALLGEPERTSSKENVAVFKSRAGHTVDDGYRSVLDWGFAGFSELVLFDTLARSSPKIFHSCQQDAIFTEYFQTDALKTESHGNYMPKGELRRYSGLVPWMDEHPSIDLNQELARTIKAQSYYLAGIGYKSALLSHIIRDNRHCETSGRYADFGGGYGLLAAESLLDNELSFTASTVRDIAPLNQLLSGVLYRQLRGQLRSRFRFSMGPAEGFEFQETFSVITFIGSLLYVPKDLRQTLLNRCWDSLEDGGILIVHENIRNSSFTRDFEMMFEVEEIDEMLSRYGDIRRYMSTAVKEITTEEAGGKTIFRAVAKRR